MPARIICGGKNETSEHLVAPSHSMTAKKEQHLLSGNNTKNKSISECNGNNRRV